jgi:hypothetical protein
LVFISKRKLFQELFENVFEVLEKKKEKEIISFSASGRKPSFSRALLFSFGPAESLFSLDRGLRSGPAQLPLDAGRRAFSLSVSLTSRARL